jgi:hypothetical protein
VCHVVHAKAQSLALKSDDARASGTNHLNLGAIVEPHLAETMDHLAAATHPTNPPLLSGTQERKRHQVRPMNYGQHLSRDLHAASPARIRLALPREAHAPAEALICEIVSLVEIESQ